MFVYVILISCRLLYQIRMAALNAALAEMNEANEPDVLREGVPMIAMYISKLLANPGVPRYRRISCSNNHYQTVLSKVKVSV